MFEGSSAYVRTGLMVEAVTGLGDSAGERSVSLGMGGGSRMGAVVGV